MSTNSLISIKEPSGKTTGIYCHWDGYIDGVGTVLYHCYQNVNKIRELIALGDISYLEEKVAPTKPGHSFDHPEANVTVAYHRDRGEEFNQITADTYEEFLVKSSSYALVPYRYLYVVEESRWMVNGEPLSKYFDIEPVRQTPVDESPSVQDFDEKRKDKFLKGMLKATGNNSPLTEYFRPLKPDVYDLVYEMNVWGNCYCLFNDDDPNKMDIAADYNGIFANMTVKDLHEANVIWFVNTFRAYDSNLFEVFKGLPVELVPYALEALKYYPDFDRASEEYYAKVRKNNPSE